MASFENLKAGFDPFNDEVGQSYAKNEYQKGVIHIRIQQRNGRKTLTTVQGISDAYDKKKLARYAKKEFACNGTVVMHPEYGEVLQFQGDQRNHIARFLTRIGLAAEEQIKMHGF
eukprot:m.307379 g.307379  ORF g.307379 m.307379 type:complete len:115 (+) comp42214_c0_seq1:71-415(+)